MALDRDLSVAVAQVLARRLDAPRWSAWEMLSATGVRSLRVLAEASLYGSLLLTEANPDAIRVLRANAALFRDRGVSVLHHDAHRIPPGAPFDLVDLDPYGSPAPFAEALFGSVRTGGVVAVTATDMRVLAGADPEACERRYGARPVRGRLGPESGLRILLGWIAREAALRGRSARPLLAYVHGHYLRTWMEVGPGNPDATGLVVRLDPADFPGPALPGRGPFGPLWAGPLWDRAFLAAIRVPNGAARPEELGRLLDELRGEEAVGGLFFFEANELARSLALPEPPPVDALLQGLREVGWPAARTHARPGAFRTRAPRAEVERVARAAAARANPVRSGPSEAGSVRTPP